MLLAPLVYDGGLQRRFALGDILAGAEPAIPATDTTNTALAYTPAMLLNSSVYVRNPAGVSTDTFPSADILIAAIGKPGFITRDMVKEHAVVIDVGTTRIPDSSKKSGVRLVGDVDFDNVKEVCSYITPVPGGVGPMTIVSLLRNTLKAFNNKNGL